MFSGKPTVASLTESQLIDEITRWLGDCNPPSPEGIGDDCAVHQPAGDQKQILSSDALVYGQHFDDHTSAFHAGKKLINRNLSDIAAMGGVPDRAILNLMFGPDLEHAWLKEFVGGLREASCAVGLMLVGGDICRLEAGTFISVLTVLGTAEKPLTRRTANVGDAIFVTGDLGGSLEGRHACFEPRLTEGQWLGQHGHCTSLMDLTDGLAKDLPSLLAKTQAAKIDLTSLPISKAANRAAASSGRPEIEHAFCDGEDYELLFTLRADQNTSDFLAQWRRAFPGTRISHIGHVVEREEKGQMIDASNGDNLSFSRGYEHFKGA